MTEPQWFLDNAAEYARKAEGSRFPFDRANVYPCLDDRDAPNTIDAHYFHMDLWAAKIVCGSFATEQVDVGSRIDGFVAHVLANGQRVTAIDIRPCPVSTDGLSFVQADATTMSGIDSRSIESLSCLHACEHFGLGRYGDTIDPDACFKAMRSFARVLVPGGRLLFAVPIGVERVAFNAHRIFDPKTVTSTFRDAGLHLWSFAAIDDAGKFHPAAEPDDYASANYACGCFEFTRYL